MDCTVIRDLIPLYVKNNCSEESRLAVEEHAAHCPDCAALLQSAKDAAGDKKPSRRLLILLGAELALCLTAMLVGVVMEGRTPQGISNGYWYLTFLAPAAALLATMPVMLLRGRFRSRRRFVLGCVLVCLAAFAVLVGMGLWRYDLPHELWVRFARTKLRPFLTAAVGLAASFVLPDAYAGLRER